MEVDRWIEVKERHPPIEGYEYTLTMDMEIRGDRRLRVMGGSAGQ
jgi:hypothetical protein